MPDPDPAEVCRRGREIYDRDIRALVEPDPVGKFLVLDIETGHYEIDAREGAAIDRAIAKHPDGLRYIIRVGFSCTHKFGGSSFRFLSRELRRPGHAPPEP